MKIRPFDKYHIRPRKETPYFSHEIITFLTTFFMPLNSDGWKLNEVKIMLLEISRFNTINTILAIFTNIIRFSD